MAKQFLVPIDLIKNELRNARIQNLASEPSSPVVGQVFYNTTSNKFGVWNGTAWDYMGVGSATGDVSSNTATSVDGELVLFNSTTGKSIKRANLTGIIKAVAGVASAAVAGTDYLAPGTTLNQIAAPTTDFSMNSKKLTNLLDPTAAQDAATKNYVDNALQGLSWKTAVRAIATSNITLSAPQTIDGVSLIAGDRVIVAGQSTASQNGLYVVAAGAWSRATDADVAAELVNATAYVSEGTTNADTVWTVTTNAPITVGSTSITFAQVNGGAIPDASTSTKGKVQLATSTEAEARSDTGKSVTPAALVNFGVKKSFLIGDGSATSIAVTHNLGTRDVIVAVYDASTYAVVECDITNTSTTQVTLGFATAPASNSYRVVVIG